MSTLLREFVILFVKQKIKIGKLSFRVPPPVADPWRADPSKGHAGYPDDARGGRNLDDGRRLRR
jgi:hypothetical protein